VPTGLVNSIWGWGTTFVDLDNDADLDHAAVCDSINHVASLDVNSVRLNPCPALLAGGVHVAWADVSTLLPDFSKVLVSTTNAARGRAAGDLDADGDIDLVVTNTVGRAGIFENTLASPNARLELDLVNAGGSLDDTGARVYLRRGKRTQPQEVFAGSSFPSQESSRLRFGLGPLLPYDLVRGTASAVAAAGIVAGPATPGAGSSPSQSPAWAQPTWLFVRWPDGASQVVKSPRRNTIHTIVRSGIDDTGDLDGDGHLTSTDLALLVLAAQDLALSEATYPNRPGSITGDVNDDGVIDSDDLAAWSLLPPHWPACLTTIAVRNAG